MLYLTLRQIWAYFIPYPALLQAKKERIYIYIMSKDKIFTAIFKKAIAEGGLTLQYDFPPEEVYRLSKQLKVYQKSLVKRYSRQPFGRMLRMFTIRVKKGHITLTLSPPSPELLHTLYTTNNLQQFAKIPLQKFGVDNNIQNTRSLCRELPENTLNDFLEIKT